MKLGDLRTMGSLEKRIYNGLSKLVMFGYPGNFDKGFYSGFGSLTKVGNEIKDLEIKDIFDMYSEKEIMRSPNFGAKCMERLKELV